MPDEFLVEGAVESLPHTEHAAGTADEGGGSGHPRERLRGSHPGKRLGPGVVVSGTAHQETFGARRCEEATRGVRRGDRLSGLPWSLKPLHGRIAKAERAQRA